MITFSEKMQLTQNINKTHYYLIKSQTEFWIYMVGLHILLSHPQEIVKAIGYSFIIIGSLISPSCGHTHNPTNRSQVKIHDPFPNTCNDKQANQKPNYSRYSQNFETPTFE